MQQLMKPQELATIFNVSPPTILNWYYGGLIPARIHVGRVIRFDLMAVMAELDRANDEPLADEFFRRRKRTKRIL